MHSFLLCVAGMLALLTLAFGAATAGMIARCVIYAALGLLGLLLADILTHGAISDALVPRSPQHWRG
jgi:hypothetical protein